MNPSLASKIITSILKLIRFKSIVALSFKNPPRHRGAFVPKGIQKKFALTQHIIHGKPLVTLTPKKVASQKHLLFFHGGAYVLEMSSLHWSLVAGLSERVGAKVTVVDYPLAPEHTFHGCYAMLHESYRWLLQNHPEDEFIFIGDSAGGGLALGFTQDLIALRHPKPPIKTILISPWLDVSLDNPALEAMDDVVLSLDGLRYCASRYAKPDEYKNPKASPLFGDISELPPTLILYGTAELMYPDIELLRAKAQSQNPNLTFISYPKMPHDWVLFPIPEAKTAMDYIIAFVEASLPVSIDIGTPAGL